MATLNQMTAWGRKVVLKVGRFPLGNENDGEFLDLSNLDIEFEVVRSIKFWENKAAITVWNPGPQSLAYLMNEAPSLILQAGYGEEVGNVFVGQIASVHPRRDGANVRVDIVAKSARGAYYQLVKTTVDFHFKKGDTVKHCLQEFADYAGLALRAGSGSVYDEKIESDFQAATTIQYALKSFADYVLFPLTGCKLYFDNNEIMVVGQGNSVEFEEVTLDFEHGLLSAYPVREETSNAINGGGEPYYMMKGVEELEKEYAEYFEKKEKEIEHKEQMVDSRKKVQFTCLMNSKIAPNVFVNIDSRHNDKYDDVLAVNGRFIVEECTFKGSNCGYNFDIEGVLVEAPEDGL